MCSRVLKISGNGEEMLLTQVLQLVVDLQGLILSRLGDEARGGEGSLGIAGVQVALNGRWWGRVGRRVCPDRLQQSMSGFSFSLQCIQLL